MRAIDHILDSISRTPGCSVHPAAGAPPLPSSCALPDDLQLFYKLCGGLILFGESAYGMEVVGPAEFVRANPAIVGEDDVDDPSHDWFIVGQWEEQYVTVDLAPSRLGRCYDSFWDRHASPGNCPVIAQSFTDFLAQSLDNGGEYWYWLQDDFPSLGDAYDSR